MLERTEVAPGVGTGVSPEGVVVGVGSGSVAAGAGVIPAADGARVASVVGAGEAPPDMARERIPRTYVTGRERLSTGKCGILLVGETTTTTTTTCNPTVWK